MTSKDKEQISLHLDRDFFRAALAYTSEATGFSPLNSSEKDYYCSVLLSYFSAKIRFWCSKVAPASARFTSDLTGSVRTWIS